MRRVDRGTFVCSGCGALEVRGIYCEPCRDARAEAAKAAAMDRGERLRALWAADPEGMKAKLNAGRAPAQEGK